jgi:hypothetical protein
VRGGIVKEIEFFDRYFDRGVDWYRAHFARAALARIPAEEEARTITGEATANYLFFPRVPARVLSVVPDVKLIVLLRNPVERAYSHYQLSVNIGVEQLSFEDAIRAEPERLGINPGQLPSEFDFSPNFRFHAYLSKGLYAQQLDCWRRHFDLQRVLVIQSERLYANSESVLREVADFLELPEWSPMSSTKTNSLRYAPMNDAIRCQLSEFFEPHNHDLYSLIGQSMEWT